MENRDHFRQAMRILVGPGPAKQRLCEAYLKHLQRVEVHDLPRDLQPAFSGLKSALHNAQAAGGLGVVEVAVRKMSEHEAGQFAAGVLEMFAVLVASEGREPSTAPPRPLRIVADDDLPAFLNRA